jgi:hypothetical protein
MCNRAEICTPWVGELRAENASMLCFPFASTARSAPSINLRFSDDVYMFYCEVVLIVCETRSALVLGGFYGLVDINSPWLLG